MERDGEKKTVRQCILDWWLPFVAVVLVIGAGRSFVLWQDRNYGQLTTSLITVLGVVVTLWMTQVRAIEQQEREDKRHHARLEAEAKIHDERLRAEAQKDRAQRSITQRIDLAEKLSSTIDHLSSDNRLQQAVGVQEILFQIDDWYVLTEAEIAEIVGEEEQLKYKRDSLRREGLRHRQELFDIAYKFKVEDVDILKSRARGIRQRLTSNEVSSLVGIDMSNMIIGNPKYVRNAEYCQDLRGIVLCGVKMYGAYLQGVDLRKSNLCDTDLSGAQLKGANLCDTDLSGAQLKGANLCDADLSGAQLKGVVLTSASLVKARLINTTLTSCRFEGADLSGVFAPGSNFIKCNMHGVNFRDANMEGVKFCDTLLRSANFRNANLRDAHFNQANLLSADLSSANLCGVNFNNTKLPDYKLKNAVYDHKTIFPEGFDPRDPKFGLIWFTEKPLEF